MPAMMLNSSRSVYPSSLLPSFADPTQCLRYALSCPSVSWDISVGVQPVLDVTTV